MFLASSSLKRHQYKCCSIAVRLPIPLLQAEGIEVIYPRLSVPRHLLPEVTRVTWNISDNAELFKPFRYGVRSPCGTDRQTDGRTNSNADSFPYNAGAEASNTRNRGVRWPTLMITVQCSPVFWQRHFTAAMYDLFQQPTIHDQCGAMRPALVPRTRRRVKLTAFCLNLQVLQGGCLRAPISPSFPLYSSILQWSTRAYYLF